MLSFHFFGMSILCTFLKMLSDAERKALLDLGTKFKFVNSGEDVSDGPGALATMTHQKDCKTYRKAR